jgi:hypothetical protein
MESTDLADALPNGPEHIVKVDLQGLERTGVEQNAISGLTTSSACSSRGRLRVSVWVPSSIRHATLVAPLGQDLPLLAEDLKFALGQS